MIEIWLLTAVLLDEPKSALERGKLLPPIRLEADGQPIDTERDGHAAPFMGDFDGDGADDLLIGEFFEGRLRVFPNRGSNDSPLFDDFEWFSGRVPEKCYIGFTPQLVDFDADGRTDVISGCYPGEVYLFRRQADGGFAAGETLRDAEARTINVGQSAAVFACDWDADGDLDLLIGTYKEVWLIPNEGTAGNWRFGAPHPMQANGEAIAMFNAAPVAADWDADGLLDLIVGREEGSVLLYRNVGQPGEPKLAEAETLIPDSPHPWGLDSDRRPEDWGVRAKVCIVDWNRDGRMDILLGDRCGGFTGKPRQTEQERLEELAAASLLPEVRAEWARRFQEYRRMLQAKSTQENAAEQEDSELASLRRRLEELKVQIADQQLIVDKYREQSQSHGYVWLFLRSDSPEQTRSP